MPLSVALAEFNAAIAQCDRLIANAHKQDVAGAHIFPPLDREQITVAGFLNSFIAWEGFVESAISNLMAGAPTIGGTAPTKYVSPIDVPSARKIIVGVMQYFDYANHENVRRIAQLYFDQGYPFEPHIAGIMQDLTDLKIMRNASAHISASTQAKLEALAQRIFGIPKPGIKLYDLLLSKHPTAAAGQTVFAAYKEKLVVTAALIAQG